MTLRTAAFISVCVTLLLIWILESGAADVFLEATRPDFQKIPLGVAGIQNHGGPDWLGGRIEEVLKADVRRSLVFSLVDLHSVGIKVSDLGTGPDPAFKQAGEHGVSVIVWGKASMKSGEREKDSDIHMDGFVYDAGSDEVVGGKRYVGSSSVARLMAHRFADELVFRYTGEPGIARTKVAYVSEQGSARELFVMDYDGYDARQLTADGFLNLMPRWSPDRRFLVFTAYRNRNTQDIDTRTKAMQRLTVNASGDLSPSWSPSGRELAFTSDRSGGPQVFLMSGDGSNVRRLTFEGDYNAAPAWSPRGNWIAYVCRTPKKEYKLCVITPDGQKRVQLTTGPGVDDSPSWSPDGRHIVFSSTADGKSQIYMINADGKDLERITFTGTHNSAPSWSPAS